MRRRSRRRFVSGKRSDRLRPPGDLIEVIGRAGRYGHVGVLLTPVDQNLVLALPTGKPNDPTSHFIVRNLVLGVTAIALESHRSHRCERTHSFVSFPAWLNSDRSPNCGASSTATQYFTCLRVRSSGSRCRRREGQADSPLCDETSADPLHRRRCGSWHCSDRRSTRGPFPL